MYCCSRAFASLLGRPTSSLFRTNPLDLHVKVTIVLRPFNPCHEGLLLAVQGAPWAPFSVLWVQVCTPRESTQPCLPVYMPVHATHHAPQVHGVRHVPACTQGGMAGHSFPRKSTRPWAHGPGPLRRLFFFWKKKQKARPIGSQLAFQAAESNGSLTCLEEGDYPLPQTPTCMRALTLNTEIMPNPAQGRPQPALVCRIRSVPTLLTGHGPPP